MFRQGELTANFSIPFLSFLFSIPSLFWFLLNSSIRPLIKGLWMIPAFWYSSPVNWLVPFLQIAYGRSVGISLLILGYKRAVACILDILSWIAHLWRKPVATSWGSPVERPMWQNLEADFVRSVPRSELEVASPKRTVAFWETGSENALAKVQLDSQTTETLKYCVCCFQLLSVVVICYATIDNYYKVSLQIPVRNSLLK